MTRKIKIIIFIEFKIIVFHKITSNTLLIIIIHKIVIFNNKNNNNIVYIKMIKIIIIKILFVRKGKIKFYL